MNVAKATAGKADFYIESRIKYLKQETCIKKLEVNCDIEPDYESMSLSGTVIISSCLYPIAGGLDLGCGIGLYVTDCDSEHISEIKKRTTLLSENTPFLTCACKKTCKIKFGSREKKINYTLGNIAEGNHFIEIRSLEKKLAILIHSGIDTLLKTYITKLFLAIFREQMPSMIHSDNPYLLKIPIESPDAEMFLNISHQMNAIALENREYIAENISKLLGISIIEKMDSSHEFIERCGDLIVHCNGAQRYKKFRKKNRALILAGADKANYIIVQRDRTKHFVNHGIPLIEAIPGEERKYSIANVESFGDNQSKQELLILSPLCSCKRRTEKYEYTFY